jgi:hypothetical protein
MKAWHRLSLAARCFSAEMLLNPFGPESQTQTRALGEAAIAYAATQPRTRKKKVAK